MVKTSKPEYRILMKVTFILQKGLTRRLKPAKLLIFVPKYIIF